MRRSLAFLAALALASPAGAYWDYGHRTIASIAMRNVAPRTRARVRRILATSALLGTPKCPARTPEDAAVWADCVKPLKDTTGKPRFGYAYGWHFQDVEICRPYDPLPACKDGNCVSAQIERDVALLHDPATAPAGRVQALAFLLHFVGDLHQPLHAGEKADKGGNDVHVSYGVYAPPKLNLHSVWDGLLAERAITSGPSLIRRYPREEKAALQAGTVADWARESWAVAQGTVYAGALGGDPCVATPVHVTISEATIEAWVSPARLEIERGGLRLAKLLDEALD